MKANRFGPAQGNADNKLGPPRPLSAIGSLRAAFHHGPEPSAPHTRPEIRLQSNPSAEPVERRSPRKEDSERKISLKEESRYALLGSVLRSLVPREIHRADAGR
jgi:hypothetical protein